MTTGRPIASQRRRQAAPPGPAGRSAASPLQVLLPRVMEQRSVRAAQLRGFKHGVVAAKARLEEFLKSESDIDALIKKHDDLDRSVSFAFSAFVLLNTSQMYIAAPRRARGNTSRFCWEPALACILAAVVRRKERDYVAREIAKKQRARSATSFFFNSSASDAYHDFLTLPDKVFYEHFRMTKQAFLILAERCEPHFARDPRTPGRKPVPGRVRLLHILRIMAQSTASFRTESIVARVNKNSLHARWLPTVAKAITRAIPIPRNPARSDTTAWIQRKRGFIALQKERSLADKDASEIWRRTFADSWGGFKGVVEVFDGCVLPLLDMPRKYGVDARDYRHWSKGWSINTIAGVDANGRFTSMATGFPGTASDTAMLRTLLLHNANEGDPYGDREDAYPPGCIAIGDGGFGLLRWLMLPFSNKAVLRQVGTRRQAMKLFNFKLAQLRVVVEQAFGRWKGRWRILKRIPASPDVAGDIAEACACLHNFLEEMGGNDVLPQWIEDIEAEEKEEEENRRLRLIAEEAIAQGPEALEVRRAAEAERVAASATFATLEGKAARRKRLNDLVACVSGGHVSLQEDVSGVIAGMPTPASLRGTF